MKLVNMLKTTPLWLLLPLLMFVGMTAFAVSGYEPLVFDASLYDTQTAHASELRTVDAAAIEAANAEPVDAGGRTSLDGAAKLADGTWTGYAACGQGNPDGWKPYYVTATIEVSDGKVTALSGFAGSSTGNAGDARLSWDAAENQRYLTQAVSGSRGVKAQIEAALALGSTEVSVDAVSGATYSSVSAYNAYADAVNKASGGAGALATKAVPASAPQAKASTKTKAPEASDDIDQLADGTWKGYTACGEGNPDGWKPYYVEVSVKVKDGKAKAVTKVVGTSKGDTGQKALSWDAAENQSYLNWAISGRTRGSVTYKGVRDQIETALAKGQNPSSVDAVSGATYSSDAILGAYYAALAKSAKAAGSKAEAPRAPAIAKPVNPAPATPEVPDVPSVPSGDDNLVIPDGVYEGHALCQDENAPTAYAPYYLCVQIEVEDGKVVRIGEVYGDEEGRIDPAYVYDAHENASYLNKAIKGSGLFTKGVKTQIQEKLDAGESVSAIDAVSGATWSSWSIFKAYVKAVEAAVDAAKNAAAGGAGDQPADQPADNPGDNPAENLGDNPGGNEGDDADKPASGDNPSNEDKPSAEDKPATDDGRSEKDVGEGAADPAMGDGDGKTEPSRENIS